MPHPYVSENARERDRLKAFLNRLSDDRMGVAVGEHWTVSVALAHLAFWDRLWLGKFEEWAQTGVVKVPPADDLGFIAGINDGMLPWWRMMTPAYVRHDVVAAAEAADTKAADMPEAIIGQISSVRPRTLMRAVHRREVLDEIERTLGG